MLFSAHDGLRLLSRTIATERERLKRALEQEAAAGHPQNNMALKSALSEVPKHWSTFQLFEHFSHSLSLSVLGFAAECWPTQSPDAHPCRL